MSNWYTLTGSEFAGMIGGTLGELMDRAGKSIAEGARDIGKQAADSKQRAADMYDRVRTNVEKMGAAALDDLKSFPKDRIPDNLKGPVRAILSELGKSDGLDRLRDRLRGWGTTSGQ